jgi:hypothetical protein
MVEGLKSGTSEKLHPTLRLILDAIRTFREHDKHNGRGAACAGLLANCLYAIQDFPLRENFTRLPVSKDDSESASIGILRKEIVDFGPCFARTEKMSRDGLVAVPELFESTTPKPLAGFIERIHRGAAPETRVLVGPIAKALKSLRSNRDPRGTFQKISHLLILTFLFPFGALRETDSDFSPQGPLTSEELKEVFDYACPACLGKHSSEALRKCASRFTKSVLEKWPADKIKRSRSGAQDIGFRFTGLHRVARSQASRRSVAEGALAKRPRASRPLG